MKLIYLSEGNIPVVIDVDHDPFSYFANKIKEAYTWAKDSIRSFRKPLSRESPLEHLADSHCLVCGYGFGKMYVTCASCHSPYHKDCWEYMDRCSIYGCTTQQ